MMTGFEIGLMLIVAGGILIPVVIVIIESINIGRKTKRSEIRVGKSAVKEFLSVKNKMHSHGDFALTVEIENCERCKIEDEFKELLERLLRESKNDD